MKSPLAIVLSGVAAAAITWLVTHHVPVVQQGAAWLEDLQLAYFSEPRAQNRDVVLLAITEDTLARLPYRSPIDRAFLADVLRNLAEKGPRAVAIDIVFDQATTAEADQALLDAMDAFPAPLVLAAGGAEHGLTPRQLDFQHRYLAGRKVGAATVRTSRGVVREFHPGGPMATSVSPSLVAVLAHTLGMQAPAAPQRIRFRSHKEGAPPPIRAFPLHTASSLPAAWIRDRIVLIGADLPNQDRFRTPLSVLGGDDATMAGVEIHAQALAQLLEGERYPAASRLTEALILAAAVAFGCTLPFLDVNLPVKAAVAAALAAAYWIGSFAWFAHGGGQLPLLVPSLGMLLSIGFGGAYARRTERAERRFVQQAFQRYVSPSVIEHVLSDPSKLELGGEKRDMSFVFSDLAGFTSLTESHPPEVVVSLLQAYFEGMVQIALDHGGTVDRLVGDGVAVFFGAPARQPDHALRAVRCALALDRWCEAFRADRRSRGLRLGITRIGVHTGPAIVGNVGSPSRFHYTAHGDCVNTAARLERVNAHIGTRLCASLEVVRHCDAVPFRPVGHLVLKGKTRGLDCVTVSDGLSERILDEYLLAYAALERHDPASAHLFHTLYRQAPDDGLIAFHWQRVQRGESGTRIVLEEK